jgi:hypothetical protein
MLKGNIYATVDVVCIKCIVGNSRKFAQYCNKYAMANHCFLVIRLMEVS